MEIREEKVLDKKEIPAMNLGLSLIILILVNLCLLTFSVLSLENAVADLRLSKKAAEHTIKYYEAANRIQQKLKAVGEEETGTVLVPGEILSLEEPLDNGQRLVVDIRRKRKEDLRPYRIIRWQLRPSEEWEADRSLNVYIGQKH